MTSLDKQTASTQHDRRHPVESSHAESVLPDALHLMGVKVTPFVSYDQAVASVSGILRSGEKAFSVAINPEKIYRALHDKELRGLLNRAGVCICDGIGAAMAVRFLCGKNIVRVTGISLFYELIRAAAERQWPIFLLGAAPEVNAAAAAKLILDYPQLRIVGRQDGYFKDSAAVVQTINDSGAQLLFVAMGSPKQEFWIAENLSRLNSQFCMGVGGTFDVVSGKAKWAPAICRKTGTEWLYRLISDPKRWRRQLVLPKFAWAVLKEKISKRAPV